MSYRKKLRSFFFKKDGEKEVLDKKRIILLLVCFIGFGALVLITFRDKKDTSIAIQSMEPIPMERHKNESPVSANSKKVNKMLNSSVNISRSGSSISHSKANSKYVKSIEYKAPQVIQRKGADGMSTGVPIGTNLVGKLLTAIDTREVKQLYKVLLPYGGKDKNGGSVPKNTILFGHIKYPGKGKKVFIQFNKALLPNGKEVILKAQALNSKSYSPGLTGEFHGKATERVVSTLGLAMVSAMAETLTEKEALGGGNATMAPTPKANMENALYQGVSRVSEMEASRQASELSNDPEYVTIPAGKEMIVNLISTYYGDQ